MATGTRHITESATKPFDPAHRQQEQLKAQAVKKQKQQQQAMAKRRKQQQPQSPLKAWLFPEPKQPRTLSEWLSQDRPGS